MPAAPFEITIVLSNTLDRLTVNTPSLRDARMRVRGPAGVRQDVILRHPPGRLSGSSTFRASGTPGRWRARPLRGQANSRAMGAGRPRWARRLVEIECRLAALHSRLMWVLTDVVGLFSINVGPLSSNVGRVANCS